MFLQEVDKVHMLLIETHFQDLLDAVMAHAVSY